jgi:hypothetical protein
VKAKHQPCDCGCGELAEAAEAKALLESTRRVLGYRERELLDLKGPCSTCRLHHAHSGPCDTPAHPTTKRPPKITVSFRIDPDLWAEAEAKAEAKGELRAEVIRRALERYVSRS